jgi:phosphoribosyl 1,2-cyclic phosphodiesterase
MGVRGSVPTPISIKQYQEKVKEAIGLAIANHQNSPSQFKIDEFYASLPVELRQPFGGNTTCLYVTTVSGKHLIFDMGTGIRELGNRMAPQAFGGEGWNLHIFMTHTHWDHIMGWPFFKPAYSPKVNIQFYSCIQNLEERLRRQQHPEHFPVPFDAMASKKTFNQLENFQSFMIDELEVIPFPLVHPGACTGYKIKEHGKSLLFCTDVEYVLENEDFYNTVEPIIHGSDILIIDGQYSSEEAVQKAGWGHTSMRAAYSFASKAKIKTVVLTHHEPDYSDKHIIELSKKEIPSPIPDTKYILGYEGLIIEI